MSVKTSLLSTPVCNACQHISFGSSGIRPHEAMQQQGDLDADQRDGHTAKKYICLTCETQWLQHIDKWGYDCGFRLAS